MRRKLMNLLVDLLIQRHGLYPKSFEKTMFAKAVVTLFPKFKFNGTEHGTVSAKYLILKFVAAKIYIYFSSQELLYNPSKDSGWLVAVLRTRRQANKRDQMNQQMLPLNDSNDANASYTEDQAKNDIEILRTMQVNQSNMPEITQRLKSTIGLRNGICDDVNVNLLERFPYFFTHSHLVSCIL